MWPAAHLNIWKTPLIACTSDGTPFCQKLFWCLIKYLWIYLIPCCSICFLTFKDVSASCAIFLLCLILGIFKQIPGNQLNVVDTSYCYPNFCIIGLISLQNIVSKKLNLAKAIGENRIKRLDGNDFAVSLQDNGKGCKKFSNFCHDIKNQILDKCDEKFPVREICKWWVVI